MTTVRRRNVVSRAQQRLSDYVGSKSKQDGDVASIFSNLVADPMVLFWMVVTAVVTISRIYSTTDFLSIFWMYVANKSPTSCEFVETWGVRSYEVPWYLLITWSVPPALRLAVGLVCIFGFIVTVLHWFVLLVFFIGSVILLSPRTDVMIKALTVAVVGLIFFTDITLSDPPTHDVYRLCGKGWDDEIDALWAPSAAPIYVPPVASVDVASRNHPNLPYPTVRPTSGYPTNYFTGYDGNPSQVSAYTCVADTDCPQGTTFSSICLDSWCHEADIVPDGIRIENCGRFDFYDYNFRTFVGGYWRCVGDNTKSNLVNDAAIFADVVAENFVRPSARSLGARAQVMAATYPVMSEHPPVLEEDRSIACEQAAAIELPRYSVYVSTDPACVNALSNMLTTMMCNVDSVDTASDFYSSCNLQGRISRRAIIRAYRVKDFEAIYSYLQTSSGEASTDHTSSSEEIRSGNSTEA